MGIHLPTPKDRIAAHTANQMNAIEKRYFQMPLSGVKNSPNVVTARMVSVPPSQIGFDSQYRTELIEAGEAPERELDPDVEPPSSAKEEPSSAASSA